MLNNVIYWGIKVALPPYLCEKNLSLLPLSTQKISLNFKDIFVNYVFKKEMLAS